MYSTIALKLQLMIALNGPDCGAVPPLSYCMRSRVFCVDYAVHFWSYL